MEMGWSPKLTIWRNYFLGGQEGPFRYQPRGTGWEEVQASKVPPVGYIMPSE